MADKFEITHRVSVPHGDRGVEIYGWQNHANPARWILNASLHTDLPRPHDRVAFPATVEAPDFGAASELAVEVGISRYVKWRSELDG